ncbi:MAG TPA: hypothetical protein VMQ99_02495, partial [Acetobacteraceae bacterium]|nr:hypothetical protein [Acetobacteraceae bacterium]
MRDGRERVKSVVPWRRLREGCRVDAARPAAPSPSRPLAQKAGADLLSPICRVFCNDGERVSN